MSQVYRATNATLGRQIAIKSPDAFATNPERLVQFARDAKAPRVPGSSAHRAIDRSGDVRSSRELEA